MRKLIFFTLFISVFLYNSSKRATRLDWDVFGYYLYLPAQFIYHDIELNKKEEWLTPLRTKYPTGEGFYQAYKGPKDKYVMKYTMGLSFVYSPFFFIADFMAPKLGYGRDGFSPPYQYIMLFCALLFSLIGLYYLFKILEMYFKPTIVFATVALMVFGTNYYVMTTYDGLMPHNFVFTFYAIMLYYTIKWYDNQKVKYAIIIGLSLGLSILIRPTSIVVAIIPLFWNIGSWVDLKNRITLFFKNYFHILILGFSAFIVILPQLIYWKSVSGQWLYYSYPDEKVDLLKPHIINVLFSYKKGWLLYTPLICFAIWGFISLYKQSRTLFYSIFIFFLINAYIISCWDCWWYGGSFAQRPFVESYVFMAFPLATFVNTIKVKKYLAIIPSLFISIFFIHLNLFQTHQAVNGIIHTTLTTKEYYWKVFLKNEATDDDKRWLEPSQYGDTKDNIDTTKKYNQVYSAGLVLDNYSSNLNSANMFSQQLVAPNNLEYDVADNYLVTTMQADTSNTAITTDVVAHLVTTIHKNGTLYEYRSHDFSYNQLKNSGGKAQMTILIPPQLIERKYQLVSYVYINDNAKLKLKLFKIDILKQVK